MTIDDNKTNADVLVGCFLFLLNRRRPSVQSKAKQLKGHSLAGPLRDKEAACFPTQTIQIPPLKAVHQLWFIIAEQTTDCVLLLSGELLFSAANSFIKWLSYGGGGRAEPASGQVQGDNWELIILFGNRHPDYFVRRSDILQSFPGS